jgi:RNA polymerase sigma-70 factor, ECF subfamily
VRGLPLDMANQDTLPAWEEKALAALDTGEIDKALNALITGCGQAILAYCLARLGDEAIANDVAQEVFAAAWEALPDFRRESSLRTWIFVIAHHRCANRRRTLDVCFINSSPVELPYACTVEGDRRHVQNVGAGG